MMKTVSLSASLISLSLYAMSQDSSVARVTELDPVTITSSINPLPVSKTGRNIVSIPGDQFNKLPVRSVDELLRFIPGVEMQMRGPEGSQSDIVIRGATFEQVLVIVDGLRVNDPNSGHFASYIPISPSEIDHIEILKGASSAIYGSEAVGGVIHIITKSFAAKKNKSDKQLQASATAGEYNLFDGNLGGLYSNGSTVVGGGLVTNNSDGQLQRGTRGFFNNHTGSLSLKQFINDNWSIALRSAYDIRDFGAQNFYTTFLSDTATEKVTTSWNQLSLQYAKRKHHLIFDGGFKAVKDHYAYNESSIANENFSRLFQLQATDNFQLNNDGALVSGVQYQRKWIHSNDRGDHLINQAAAFVVLNQSLSHFTFSPSLRLDYSDARSTELVPQLNLSYHLPSWQFRGSVGKTIRDADFTERYNNYNKTLVTGGSIGNPDLQAERSVSYEIGADYFTHVGLKLSASIFRRDQKNVIDWAPTPYIEMPRKVNLSPTGSYALASNIANLNTTGLETDIQYSKQLANSQQLIAILGFVWLDDKTNEATPSFYISSHAKLLTNASVQYSNRFFSLAATGIFKHRQQQQASGINAKVNADYFLMNLVGNIYVVQHKLSAFVEIDNLFNNKVSDLLGSQLPGRWLMGGVKANIW